MRNSTHGNSNRVASTRSLTIPPGFPHSRRVLRAVPLNEVPLQ
jgi:hypothetical protein